MTELTPKGPRARTGLAGSVLLHAAFITAAVLSLPHWHAPPEPQGIEVSLVPLELPPPALRPPRAQPRPLRAAAAAPPAPAAPLPAQAAKVAAPISPLAQTPAAGDDSEARARATAVLRGSFGCSEESFAHLSQRELDRCAKWRQAQATPGLEIPALIEHNKRAWFDATVAARNAPDHPPVGGCFGKGPPHSIKLWPLPCYIDPPKGPFSEDVDAPTEPEHSP